MSTRRLLRDSSHPQARARHTDTQTHRYNAAYVIWNIEDAHARSIPRCEAFYNLAERDSGD